MSSSASSETQLLAEHFGYPPVSLLDDIINSINILAEQALNSVERGLLGAAPASLGFRAPAATKSSRQQQQQQQDEVDPPMSPEEAHRHEVENGTHQLETLLCASIDRNFDIFEIWVMRNILTVRASDRDWIRLSHYDGLDLTAANREVQKQQRQRKKPADGGDDPEDARADPDPDPDPDLDPDPDPDTDTDAPTLESVARLRRRLHASQKLNVMLHAERARNARLLDELRAFLHGMAEPAAAAAVKSDPDSTAAAGAAPSLAFLRNKGDLAGSDAVTPLTTTAAFTLSQLQALRALSTSLRTAAPDLLLPPPGGSAAAAAADGTSWRAERLEYVEAATRRHLEHARGLELAAAGDVRDGEWQGQGRTLAPGEVEGLEKVAALLGGAGQGSLGVGGGGGGDGDDDDDDDDDDDEAMDQSG